VAVPCREFGMAILAVEARKASPEPPVAEKPVQPTTLDTAPPVPVDMGLAEEARKPQAESEALGEAGREAELPVRHTEGACPSLHPVGDPPHVAAVEVEPVRRSRFGSRRRASVDQPRKKSLHPAEAPSSVAVSAPNPTGSPSREEAALKAQQIAQLAQAHRSPAARGSRSALEARARRHASSAVMVPRVREDTVPKQPHESGQGNVISTPPKEQEPTPVRVSAKQRQLAKMRQMAPPGGVFASLRL